MFGLDFINIPKIDLSENMIIIGLVVLIVVLVAMKMMKKRNAMKKNKMPQLFDDNEIINDNAETESVSSSRKSSRKSELPGYMAESQGCPIQ